MMTDPYAERPRLAVDMPPPDHVGVDLLRGTHSDELVDAPPATPTPPATGDLNQPERQLGPSMQYHRPPIGQLVDTFVQDLGIGAEVKQSGAGRAFLPAPLAFPVQSDTPMPDGRRIARPMPSVARDQAEVIRPPEAGAR